MLSKNIGDSELSSTIHGVISARIDRLEAEMKRILQEAAVIGRAFYYEILSHITELEDSLWHHLSSLETLDLIKARSYRPAVEYIFKHALTREVVFKGLVKGQRKAIHERVALVMEKLFEDRLPEYYETLAYHFQDSIESAGQIGANATLGRVYRDWGRLYQEKGDTDKAAECFAQANTYLRLCGSEALAEHVFDDKVRETKPDIVEYANKAEIINGHLNM